MSDWHTATINKFKNLPVESLEYIRKDALEASRRAYELNAPKAGQYMDEYHYACAELKRRGITTESGDKA